ncbi:hypothetical protein [Phenylobacterium sp.]|uniref:hypothetical protein n=1 Tax=Phenylobacterium sp. TaxID=1871053 RepID=UPI0035AFDE3A
MAAEIQLRDHVIWISHIRGDDELKSWLTSVPAGALIELELDGWRAAWRKMDDGKDGRPTSGFKPVGGAEVRWNELQSERGRWMSLRLCEDH